MDKVFSRCFESYNCLYIFLKLHSQISFYSLHREADLRTDACLWLCTILSVPDEREGYDNKWSPIVLFQRQVASADCNNNQKTDNEAIYRILLCIGTSVHLRTPIGVPYVMGIHCWREFVQLMHLYFELI